MSKEQEKSKKLSKEEQDAEDDRMLDRIADKVAQKLADKQAAKVIAPYSCCPICGHTFASKEEEDAADECPDCDFTGETVKLNARKKK